MKNTRKGAEEKRKKQLKGSQKVRAEGERKGRLGWCKLADALAKVPRPGSLPRKEAGKKKYGYLGINSPSSRQIRRDEGDPGGKGTAMAR